MTNRFPPLGPGDPAEVANYVLRARLGSGGMGTVYLSFSRGARPIAIKIVRQDLADDPNFRYRFAREIAAAQQVQGHYTAAVVDADPDAPLPWFASTYIPGPSLHKAVADYGPLPLFAVFRLLGGAAEGIAAVHAAGLVHRDLKPANVLLAEDGPRVIDFGIAHSANSAVLTVGSIGTPAYMAPEQFQGRPVAATDVFGLGQLALYAATGHAAFGGGSDDTLRERITRGRPWLDGCPEQLAPVVQWCLAKNPADRPDVTEVMDYARNAMGGDMMRVLNEPWLPPPLAATLPEYAPSAAPPRRPSRPLPVARSTAPAVTTSAYLSPAGMTSTVVPSGVMPPQAGATRPRRRWLSRLAVGLSIAAALAVGAFGGYQLHKPPATAAPPSPSLSPAATGSTSPTEWTDAQLQMPIGCPGADDLFPYYISFTTTGPVPNHTADTPGGDIYVDCSGTNATQFAFDGHAAGPASGSPGEDLCYQDSQVSQVPGKKTVGHPEIPLPILSTGAQYCVYDANSHQLAFLRLTQKNTNDLTWSAKAWYYTPS
jgi:eukaryotic-like serine/threonine-protein kinase